MKAMKHTEFRAWRAKKKMTQRQAAVHLGLSVATIRAYEADPRRTSKGRRVPVYMRRYMEALDNSEKLLVAPAALRRQVTQHWREWNKRQQAKAA